MGIKYFEKGNTIMKKTLSLLIVLILLVSAGNALALGYTGSQGNEATFELLEETRVSGPIAVANLETNVGKLFVSHPVLDNYPEGTTYVYRSANLYGGRASARQNTNIVVFAEQRFEGKDAAYAYLESLGLIAIIDEAIGSVVLVTPSNQKTGFSAADQKNYYALQTAMFAQKAGGPGAGRAIVDADGKPITYYSDAEYFGGYSFFYVVGIDGGATFVNNYVAGTLDYVSRIGSMLLINGKMERINDVAGYVPAYLVNAPQAVVEKYKAVNKVGSIMVEGDKETTYCAGFPSRKVVTLNTADVDAASLIKDAYYNLFVKTQRSQSTISGLLTASTPYQGYGSDNTPYSLMPRNAIINGSTVDGINIFTHQEDRFKSVATPEGEFLETWYEYLPDEVLNGKAPDGTVPLLILMHGGGDDPRLYVEEQGYLELMGAERIAAVAYEHQYITDIISECTPLIVKYMLETYPALDPSRVYVTGYSMGGWATHDAVLGGAELFAAAVPQAIIERRPTEEQLAQFKSIDIPVMCTTSEYDYFVEADTHNMGPRYYAQFNQVLGFNEMPLLDTENLDYDTYPISGFKADIYKRVILNDEYANHTWLFLKDGVPMAGVNYTENNKHALYAEYANVVWDFCKHYSRNQVTKEIIYDPYVR